MYAMAADSPHIHHRENADLNVFYSEGWGMSETTSLGISNPVLGRVKPLSIGLPVIDCDVRIVDPDTGEDAPQGQTGELVVKSLM